jgi:rod shape determining protein RodA
MLQKSFVRFNWKFLIAPWQEVDGWLFVLPVLLTVLGGVAIRSTQLNGGLTSYWLQHLTMGAIGLVVSLLWRAGATKC